MVEVRHRKATARLVTILEQRLSSQMSGYMDYQLACRNGA